MPEVVISARGLTKVYGDLVVVKGIDFDIYEGECFGFLGPNGAGKTTSMRMIFCFTPVSGGELKVLGWNPRTEERLIKDRIGVVPQEENLDPDLSVEENLIVYARYFRLPGKKARLRVEELLELLQLNDKRKAKIMHLSGGMKRRLLIARALINNPSLIILDEPTTGLDPQARHLIWQKLRALMRSGTTMILTTHYMDEAAQLCDRLVVMDHGEIIASGVPAELVQKYVGREVVEIRVGGGEETARVRSLLAEHSYPHESAGDTVFAYPTDNAAPLISLLMRRPDWAYLHRPATLEDVFFKLTGRELRD